MTEITLDRAYRPDRRSATLADVARAAGVSKGTASNVFNRPGIVRKEVRERVLEVARAIGYRGPDPKGRLLSAGKVNAIGVATLEPLSYFFDDSFTRTLMRGITETCDAHGLGISLVSAAKEEDLVWNMRSAVVDGFILFCLDGANRLIELASERQLPAVALDYGGSSETVSAIGPDNLEGARAAASHLAELGHRRFAILAMELSAGSFGRVVRPDQVENAVYASSQNRIRGYHAALAAHGIDPAPVPIFETLSDRETVEAALGEIFATPRPPTALLAQSDRIAFFAIGWLKARGLSVPGDVSIVGFDDVPEAAISDPPLTTVRQPILELGRKAVSIILDYQGKATRHTVPTDLIVRGSTAPPPGKDDGPRLRFL